MLAAPFIPFVHLGDHPPAERAARQLSISLPSTLEEFARQRLPGSERIEICHNGRQVVVHRGWSPVAAGCVAGEGDQTIPLDES